MGLRIGRGGNVEGPGKGGTLDEPGGGEGIVLGYVGLPGPICLAGGGVLPGSTTTSGGRSIPMGWRTGGGLGIVSFGPSGVLDGCGSKEVWPGSTWGVSVGPWTTG